MQPRVKSALQRTGRFLAPAKPLIEETLQIVARATEQIARASYLMFYAAQWGIPPQPEHADHRLDIHVHWKKTGSGMWVERGVFSSLCLKGGPALEIACGDGFNARHFYAVRCSSIVCCDFDPRAIRTAKRLNAAPNIEFVLADIRTNMPAGRFQNVIWDAAIEHFTPEEIEQIMLDIRAKLEPHGILSGYTIVERPGGKSLSHHEYEFKNKEDLLRFLTPHFKHAIVFETLSPGRHNLYFWASDGVLPFSDGWAAAASSVSFANGLSTR